jgi:Na+-transporting methylmalonyl-CoA/oxaloacetate decarboxylase gamma subunit
MTLTHLIAIAAKFAITYGLFLCLLGVTFIAMDQFEERYSAFKAKRKADAAKKAQAEKQAGGIAK